MSLPAVILVGGQGTRLRPLTDRTRKDMLPLVDRLLLAYTFEHLARHGVEEAIVSCGYFPDQIEKGFGRRYGRLSLEYAVEQEPLGTGGPIGFAARGLAESFFALNGDSLREADLGALVEFHRSTGARATILLTPVADPSRYGLVRTTADGRGESFLEKPRPEEIDTDLINAGRYVLEPDVLELIPSGRPVSVEREVFGIKHEELDLLNELVQSSKEMVVGGIRIKVAKASRETYFGDAAYFAHRLMDIEDIDAAVLKLSLDGKILMVARSRVPELNVATVQCKNSEVVVILLQPLPQ